MPKHAQPMILTDGDCGFCRRAAAQVPRLGVQVRIIGLHEVDLPALGVDPERAMLEMAWVGTDGDVRYGARAWAATLCTGPPFWRGVGRLMESRVGAPVAGWVYRLVADNRYRLPGGGTTCKIDDAR